jgi:hypothetical protein
MHSLWLKFAVCSPTTTQPKQQGQEMQAHKDAQSYVTYSLMVVVG